MHVEVLHGTIANSYHLLIQSGDHSQKAIVTISKEQAVEVSIKLNIPIKEY